MNVKGINVLNPLTPEKKQAIIDSFVEVVGAKYAEQITENINDTLFIFIPKLFGGDVSLNSLLTEALTNGDSFTREEFSQFESIVNSPAYQNLQKDEVVLQKILGSERERQEQFCKSVIKETFGESVEEIIGKWDYSDIIAFKMLMEGGKEILTNPTKTSKSVQSRLIRMFKELGLEEKPNLKLYASNSEIKQLLSKDNITAYQNIPKEIHVDYLKEHQIFNHAVKQIMDLNLDWSNGTVIKGLYEFIVGHEDDVNAYVASAMSKDGKLKRICVCPWSLEASDKTIIHEMTHLISEILIGNCIVKSGIGFCKQLKKKEGLLQPNAEDIVNNEYFDSVYYSGGASVNDKARMHNEIITDLIAIMVTKVFMSKGAGSLTFQPMSNSKYSCAFSFMEEFFYKYKDEYIDSYMSHDPLAYPNTFGKNNAKKLNLALSEFERAYEDNSFALTMNDKMKDRNCTLDELLAGVDKSDKEAWEIKNIIQKVKDAQAGIDKYMENVASAEM